MIFIKASDNIKNNFFNEQSKYFVNYNSKKDIDYKKESALFLDKLNNSHNEHEIQDYIKNDNKWFIPLSVIYNDYGIYNAAGNYFYKELPLGKEYKSDYAILGHNSDGYKLLLIEFETPNKIKILQNNTNDWTKEVRKGLTQLEDWKMWFDNNREYFINSMHFTEENIDLKQSQIFYLLVISRRECFDIRANNKRNQYCYENRNINIVSYDRLVDNIARL